MPRRSEHPGVYLFSRKRAKSITHYARWTHPYSGKTVETNLSELRLAQKPDRIRWAKRKSAELHKAGRGDSLPLDVAFERATADLGSWASGDYKRALDHFKREVGVEDTDQIGREQLDAFREALSASDYSARARNSRLRRVKAMIQRWRGWELCPLLTRDLVRDRLKPFREPKPKPDPLEVDAIRALPDHPFVRFVLLTGMRKGEALGFSEDWLSFDRGVIVVPAVTKTWAGRVIDLSISPLLVRTLQSDLDTIVSMTEGRARGLVKRSAGWTYQRLRQTCGSYLVNSALLPPWRAAQQLGHTLEVAQKHYYGLVSTIPDGVTTLEEAMGLA